MTQAALGCRNGALLHLTEVRIRVDRAAAVRVHLEVQVRGSAGRIAGRSDGADDLAGPHMAGAHDPRVEVGVVVGPAVAAGQPDGPAAEPPLFDVTLPDETATTGVPRRAMMSVP